MRSAIDLVDLPYAFTQNRPLTAANFLSEAQKRDVLLIDMQLEGLHRLGALIPLLRVRRDGRKIAGLARRDLNEASHFAHWLPTSPEDLYEARAEGRLTDPSREPFIPRHKLQKQLGEGSYASSVYLYSTYQLGALPLVADFLKEMRFERRADRVVAYVPTDSFARHQWGPRAARIRDLIIAASALEPRYYPDIAQQLRLPTRSVFADYDEWRRTLPLDRMKRWLGVGNDWIRNAAAILLAEAGRLDPLREWTDIVSRVDPTKWWQLRGAARSAIDLRIAAELLLRYYDDLVRAKRAKPLPVAARGFPGRLDDRLKARGSLDAALTDYGLSPHPRLVLIVEGPTERLVFPRVMAQLGVRADREFIAVEDAGGVDRDLSSLFAYHAPQLAEPGNEERYVRYERPATRFLVVLDAEGKVATREQREQRRNTWIERVMLSLPKDLQTVIVREQVSRLVYIQTWKRSGESFEFAHFTDLQLATAIHHLDRRPGTKPPINTLRIAVSGIRLVRGNLDGVLRDARIGKPNLADALWPTLERRIELAIVRGTSRKIPIVRTVNRAIHLAQELPRRNLVMVLEA